MSYENGIALFDAVTNIDESLIEQAGNYTFPKSKERAAIHFGAAAAAFAAVAGIAGAWALFGADNGCFLGAASSGYAPDYVYPAVLPLAALNDTEGITAERETAIDLGSLLTGQPPAYWCGEVTDSYTLTNTTGEDITVQAVYPYIGDLAGMNEEMPAVTVDGSPVSTEIYVGDEVWTAAVGELFTEEQQRDKLTADGEYLRKAFSGNVSLDIPVIAYQIADYGYSGNWTESDPYTLAVKYDLAGYNTRILTTGFDGMLYDNDNGLYRHSFFLPHNEYEDYPYPRYIIAVAGDITNIRIEGYKNGGCHPNERIDGVYGRVERIETTLSAIIREYMEKSEFYRERGYDLDLLMSKCDEKLREKYILGGDVQTYRAARLGEIINEAVDDERVIYQRFDVTVPAGGSVNVTAVTQKKVDWLSSSEGRYYAVKVAAACDLSLHYMSQTAYVSDPGKLEISGDIGVEPLELHAAQTFYSVKVKPASVTKN